MKKIRSVINTQYEWLISYIPEPIRKSVSGLKDKIVSALKDKILNALEEKMVSLFKKSTPKETVYGRVQKLNIPRKRIIKKPLISEENKEKIKERIIRDIQKLFETEVEKERNERLIKDKIIRNIRKLFEREQEENYYKPKRVSSFWNNNYIEYESNGCKNSNLLLDEHRNKIKPYLQDIIICLQSSDACKIQLTATIDFISSKDTKVESVMN